MKVHEYQAKELLAKYGVPVPRGEVAFSPFDVPGGPTIAGILDPEGNTVELKGPPDRPV